MQDICTSQDGSVRLYVGNSLERHRVESLLDKEPETIQWIESAMTTDSVLYDIGANIGVYSYYAAARHPGLKVYAIEPVLANFVRLTQNAALNASSSVIPLFAALSDRSKISQLFIKDERVGGSGSQVGSATDEEGREFAPTSVQHVMCFSLPDLVDVLGLPAPSHLKIDVDGLEKEILIGALPLFEKGFIASALVELNQAKYARSEADYFMKQFGLVPDVRFNSLEHHSSRRRASKGDNFPVNVVYSKLS